jgi:hypothetical protein
LGGWVWVNVCVCVEGERERGREGARERGRETGRERERCVRVLASCHPPSQRTAVDLDAVEARRDGVGGGAAVVRHYAGDLVLCELAGRRVLERPALRFGGYHWRSRAVMGGRERLRAVEVGRRGLRMAGAAAPGRRSGLPRSLTPRPKP